MDSINKIDAESLVRSIENQANPGAAQDALVLRDKWLLENDLGALQISPEVELPLGARGPPGQCSLL